MTRSLALALLIPAAFCVFTRTAPAQTVSARVLAAESSQPVIGAVVYLVNDSGVVVRRALTGDMGRAVLTGFTAGNYRLRAEMVGMATAVTATFEALPGSTVQMDIRLETQPIALQRLEVEVDQRCRVRPEEGLLAARLWDEARKALTASTMADEQKNYRYETMLYERDLALDTRVVIGEERSRRQANMRTPFRSRPAEDLADIGYVERSGGVDLYYAPDAEVLLSDLFLDSHCFRVRAGEPGRESAGLIGLSFEPVERRGRIVDITGTLWLDPVSSELRWLEYQYANLDPDIRSNEIGGRVEFRRLPDGGWIIPRWWIRMPNVALQRDDFTGTHRKYVAGLRETGGRVLRIEGRGASWEQLGTATLHGTVRDSLGQPAAGVRVEIVGARRDTVTDSAGRYRIANLVEGTYQVRFVDPRLASYGYVAEPLTRTVHEGQTAQLEFQLPATATALAEVCRKSMSAATDSPAQRDGTGILIGWVRNAVTDEPLTGALVRVRFSSYDVVADRNVYENVRGFEATADDTGFYRVCRLPENQLLTVVVVHDGVETDAGTVRIDKPGGVREHTVTMRRR